MSPYAEIRAVFTIAVVVMMNTVLTISAHSDLTYRPGQEYRSLNTGVYEIGIQKNGRLDVGLSSGEAVFINAYPMVWFEGDKEPEEARLDGRQSNRFEVNDRLGRGQGMRIQYKQNLWTLRSYPTKPFLAVHFTYTNTSKKPVTIKQLIPWAIGDPKKGSVDLGDNTLDSIMLVDTMSQRRPQRLTQEGTSANMMTVFNQNTGRSLLAGFITQYKGSGRIDMQAQDVDPDEPHQLDYMRAITTFDPPITVQPGESIDSEILYLAIAETDPLLAMERYAKAVAVSNQIPVYGKAPTRTILLSQASDQDDEAYGAYIQESIQRLKKKGPKVKSVQFVLDMNVNESHTSRPSGKQVMQWISDIHKRGFLAGLADNPFTFPEDFPEVKKHPDWFVAAPTQGDDSPPRKEVLIDITQPEAQEWFKRYIQQGAESLGNDSLWAVKPSDYLLVDLNQEYTRIEVLRLAMNTLRAALGPSVPVVFEASSQDPIADLLPVFPNTHVVQLDDRPTPFFQVPHLGHQYRHLSDPSFFKTDYALSFMQGQHWIEKPPPLLPPQSWAYFPALLRPAKPQDLFFNDSPSLWLKRGTEPTGHWILAGVRNDGDATKIITLPLNTATLRESPQYTLYDVEQGRYFGIAQHQINISVGRRKTRVLLLRGLMNQPLVVGSTYPIADTLPDATNERWDRSTYTLSGSITTRDTAGTLYVLMPKLLKPAQLTINGEAAQWGFKDDLVHIPLVGGLPAPVEWSLTFTR